jgi:hypothetical protein
MSAGLYGNFKEIFIDAIKATRSQKKKIKKHVPLDPNSLKILYYLEHENVLITLINNLILLCNYTFLLIDTRYPKKNPHFFLMTTQ